MSKNEKNSNTKKGKKEPPQRDAARELGGILDVPPEDEDYEGIVRKATRKLQRQHSQQTGVPHHSQPPVFRMRGRDRPLKTGRDSTRLNSRNVYWKQKVKNF